MKRFKIWAILMVLVMCLSACNNSGKSDKDNSDEDEKRTTTEVTSTTVEATTTASAVVEEVTTTVSETEEPTTEVECYDNGIPYYWVHEGETVWVSSDGSFYSGDKQYYLVKQPDGTYKALDYVDYCAYIDEKRRNNTEGGFNDVVLKDFTIFGIPVAELTYDQLCEAVNTYVEPIDSAEYRKTEDGDLYIFRNRYHLVDGLLYSESMTLERSYTEYNEFGMSGFNESFAFKLWDFPAEGGQRWEYWVSVSWGYFAFEGEDGCYNKTILISTEGFTEEDNPKLGIGVTKDHFTYMDDTLTESRNNYDNDDKTVTASYYTRIMDTGRYMSLNVSINDYCNEPIINNETPYLEGKLFEKVGEDIDYDEYRAAKEKEKESTEATTEATTEISYVPTQEEYDIENLCGAWFSPAYDDGWQGHLAFRLEISPEGCAYYGSADDDTMEMDDWVSDIMFFVQRDDLLVDYYREAGWHLYANYEELEAYADIKSMYDLTCIIYNPNNDTIMFGNGQYAYFERIE